MPQMARSWPTMIWAPSPLYHFINLFSALKLKCLKETGINNGFCHRYNPSARPPFFPDRREHGPHSH